MKTFAHRFRVSGLSTHIRGNSLHPMVQRSRAGTREPMVTRWRARARGFTIIEVLIAMAILLFGMTAVLGLLMFGAGLSRTALLRTTSAAAVDSVVADLEETLFPLVDGEAGPPVDIKERALPGQPDIIYSATAHENPDLPLEYRVDIEMSWKSAGVQREKRFSTLLLREIPYGERLRKQFVEGVKSEPQSAPKAAPLPSGPVNK